MTPYPNTRQRRNAAGLIDNEPRCSNCDEPNHRVGQRYCAKCHAAYQRLWRKTHNVSRGTISFTQLRGIDA